MNYRTLMTSKEIPWHNPHGLTPEQVDPNIDGWRLATLDEVCADSPLRGKCERFLDSRWDADRWYCNSLNQTYRTREPLPEKYRHLVEPDYSDPAYRASVEEAFRNGAAVEWSYKSQSRWKKKTFRWFYWNQYKYRIAPNQPAKDPAPDSDAHKLAVLMAVMEGGNGQWRMPSMSPSNWHDGTAIELVSAIRAGDLIRLKPAPVKVPLSDYGIGEAVKHEDHGIGLVCRIDSHAVKIEFHERELFFTRDAMARKCLIYRNGTWQDCFTLAD